MLKKTISRTVYNYVSHRRDSIISRQLLSVSNLIRRAYFNSSNHDIRVNGESRVLELNQRLHEQDDHYVIFDVGANEGEWSRVALEISKNCHVHAFEIVQRTREILAQNLREFPNVTICETGLSDQEQEIEINYYPEQNTGSSAFRLPWSVKQTMVKALCVRGDDYMAQNEIERIQLLKVDAEGMDYSVLSGFSKALAEQRIDAIQFEYNAAAVLSKRLLKDFYELLGGYDYAIGRVLPNKVDFKEYNLFHDENLLQSNFFAVRNGMRNHYEIA